MLSGPSCILDNFVYLLQKKSCFVMHNAPLLGWLQLLMLTEDSAPPSCVTMIFYFFSSQWQSKWEHIHVYMYIYIYIYTGCNRRNGPNFGRVFLRSNYTDITQNTYIQSSMVTEILAREVWNFDSCYTLIDYQIHIETGRNMWFL